MIKLINITKSFKDKVVVDNFSLEVKEGEMIALTGPSGCGKSTLLNIIGTLDTKYSGELIIDGEEIFAESRKLHVIRRDKMGYLFQNFALLDDETVEKNLKIVSKSKYEIVTILNKLGIRDKLKSKIYTLSGGEQQRVAIARLILKKPKIILADEPTGSLDEVNEKQIFEILKELKDEGATIIVVTHENSVLDYFDRVISLDFNAL